MIYKIYITWLTPREFDIFEDFQNFEIRKHAGQMTLDLFVRYSWKNNKMPILRAGTTIIKQGYSWPSRVIRGSFTHVMSLLHRLPDTLANYQPFMQLIRTCMHGQNDQVSTDRMVRIYQRIYQALFTRISSAGPVVDRSTKDWSVPFRWSLDQWDIFNHSPENDTIMVIQTSGLLT